MAEAGQVHTCNTLDDWNEKIKAANEHKRLIVIEFGGPWCAPSRFMAPLLVDMTKKFPQVVFLKTDIHVLPSLADDFKIHAVPTFVFMRQGKILEEVIGASSERFVETLAEHSAASSA